MAVELRKVGRLARDLAAAALAPVVGQTSWRSQRLLILAYHGISLQDEHLWDGILYFSPAMFRRRLALLRDADCTVLTLTEGLRRLYAGTLPAKAAVITFDDGFYDFAAVTVPILSEFGFPATSFVNSYYADYNRPIFDVALRYLLWKGRANTLDLPGVLDTPCVLDDNGLLAANRKIRTYAFENGLNGRQKDAILAKTAAALGIDYEAFCKTRILQSMNANDVREVHALGHEIQLHTHRHRVSRKRELFEREIVENREWIMQALGGVDPVHLSYPGGVWLPVQTDWLVGLGLESGSTGRAGLASSKSDKYRLPRYGDNSNVSERLFRSWIAGSADFFPGVKEYDTEGQILEDTIRVNTAATGVAASETESEAVAT